MVLQEALAGRRYLDLYLLETTLVSYDSVESAEAYLRYGEGNKIVLAADIWPEGASVDVGSAGDAAVDGVSADGVQGGAQADGAKNGAQGTVQIDLEALKQYVEEKCGKEYVPEILNIM